MENLHRVALKIRSTVVVAAAWLFPLWMIATQGQLQGANTLVVPAGFENQNGTGGTLSLTSAIRIQQIYAGSLFSTGPIVIHHVCWRPHVTLGSAFDATIDNLQINLSTSSANPNQLSLFFDANVGPDDVEVFHGSISLSSAFAGPAQGPKEFDIIIPLATPFLYNPSAGALLMDIRNFSGSGVAAQDGTGAASDGASRAIAFNVNQATASVTDSGADILQLIYSVPDAVPTIFQQPQGASVIADSTVHFNVTAVGEPPLSYQWRFNGTDIEGATEAQLVLENVRVDQGGLYTVRVSNGAGSVTSQEAALTVQAEPGGHWRYLLNNGFEETVAYSAVFAGNRGSGWLVEAGNIDVLTDKVGFFGPAHSGLNAIDLNGQVAGTISSNITTVVGRTYLLAFAFSKNPEKIAASAEVLLNNSSLLAFLYTQANAPSSLNWQSTSIVFTATSPTTKLTFRSLTEGNGGIYLDTFRVRAWQPAPHIISQPVSQIAYAGYTVVFRVEADGTPAFTYQWLFNGVPMEGATEATLVLNDVQVGQSGLYSVRVANALGSELSEEASLTVQGDPPIPGAFLLNSGFEDTMAYALVTSGQTFSGWRVDQGNIDVLTHGAGFFGPSHTGNNAIDLNGDTGGTISTNLTTTARQTYLLSFAYTKNHEKPGSAAEVLLNSQRLLSFSYNLPSSAAGLNWLTTSVVFTATSDATKLAFRSLASGHGGIYLDTIQLRAWPQPPQILAQPQTQFAVLGGNVVFEVSASGGLPFSYQWLFNGVELPNETNPTLTLVHVQLENQGSYTVTVSNALGTQTSAPAVLTVRVPPSILTQPQGVTTGENEDAVFQVTAAGSEPLTYQWFHNGAAIAGATGTSLVLTHVPLTAAGSYTVKVTNPVGSVTSAPATLTVNPDLGRAVLLPHLTNTLGATLAVPVLFLPDGDENGVGFSIHFNASVLELLSVELGADANAAGAFLNVNDTQAASGRLGLNLAMPFGQTFPEGTQAVVSITFSISRAGGAGVTPLSFGDSPIVREVSDIDAESLPTLFVDGSIRVSGGLEADVSPGQDGNNQVTITDWVKVGRYAAGLDVLPNATHFQRADCAPRATLGNGLLSVSDWVQAGRYAALLDPWVAAGGPTSSGGSGGAGLAAATQDDADRTVQILSVQAEPGQTLSLPIQLSSTGHENALGFSLRFDPAKLLFLGASPGADTSGASFNVNSNQQAGGSLGLALSLPVGAKFAAGTRKIALVKFAATSNAAGNVAVGFSDDPVLREVSDPLANVLGATYNAGEIRVAPVLHIRFVDSGLVLSWPAAASQFLLESRDPAGGADSWSEVEAEKLAAEDEVRVRVPAAETARFYRLRKP